VRRRRFLIVAGSAAAARLAGAPLRAAARAAAWGRSATKNDSWSKGAPASVAVSAIPRLEADLERALSRPVERRSWAMAVDVRKCIGCRACVVACKAEHSSPPSVSYRRVFEAEFGEYPQVERFFMPVNCMQCADPPCAEAAPEGAVTKRPDGIVVFRAEKLGGREVHERLVEACPYDVLSYDEGDYYTGPPLERQPYEEIPPVDYGKRGKRPTGTTRKCDFCLHRIENGRLPACVATCIGHAMYFGDANDSKSLISEIIATEQVVQLNEPGRQKPRVYHLAEDRESCARCH